MPKLRGADGFPMRALKWAEPVAVAGALAAVAVGVGTAQAQTTPPPMPSNC